MWSKLFIRTGSCNTSAGLLLLPWNVITQEWDMQQYGPRGGRYFFSTIRHFRYEFQIVIFDWRKLNRLPNTKCASELIQCAFGEYSLKLCLIMKLIGKGSLPSPAHINICLVVYLHWIPYKGFASPLIGRLTEQCCTLSYVFKMATPRRFADKIAQLKQNQEAGTRAFEEIMKKPVYELEVCTVVVVFLSWEKIRWLNSS